MTLRIGLLFGAIWTFLADGPMMTELCLTNFFKHPPNLTFSFWTKEIIWKGIVVLKKVAKLGTILHPISDINANIWTNWQA